MKQIFLAAIPLFFISCGGNIKKEIPQNLLSKETITQILIEKHLAEAEHNLKLQEEMNNGDTMNLSLILEKIKVKDSDFKNSIKYYAEHPEMLKAIYDEVINELSRRQAKLSRKS